MIFKAHIRTPNLWVDTKQNKKKMANTINMWQKICEEHEKTISDMEKCFIKNILRSNKSWRCLVPSYAFRNVLKKFPIECELSMDTPVKHLTINATITIFVDFYRRNCAISIVICKYKMIYTCEMWRENGTGKNGKNWQH